MNKIKLTDQETKELIIEMRSLRTCAEEMEEKLHLQKMDLYTPSNLQDEIRKLNLKAQNIKDKILEAHKSIVFGVNSKIKKLYGWSEDDSDFRHPPVGVTESEIISVAYEALDNFIDNFDPTSSYKFSKTAFKPMFRKCKFFVGETGFGMKRGKGILKYVETLQKLAHIRKQESHNQNRYVSINEICDRFGIDIRHVKAMMFLCYGIQKEALIKENDSGKTYNVADTKEFCDAMKDDLEGVQYESELTKAQLMKLAQFSKEYCTDYQREAFTLTSGIPELYEISIDEVAKDQPAIQRRIKEIENELLENVTDEGLLASLRGFFARRAELYAKPFPSLLKRLLGRDFFKN